MSPGLYIFPRQKSYFQHSFFSEQNIYGMTTDMCDTYNGMKAYCSMEIKLHKKLKSLCLIKHHIMKTYGGVEVRYSSTHS
jgi:hypothetical protein